MCLRELPGRHSPDKQDIQLFVRAVFDFRQTEVAPDENEERGTAPEKPTLAAPVPFDWANHVGIQELRDNVDNLVRDSRKHY